ncbi:MAG TPA: beta-galactosidase [Longimicrobiaceae bacterium]|nr:beta-galactosidase [Longimicrobiaceae bacterium]
MIRRSACAAAIALACAGCLASAPRPAPGAGGATPQRGPVAGEDHTVSFDRYSLLIDGKRTYILSGEFHYWRLPSPDLWRDVLQKMKANGYNAVSIYFVWGYHSPKRGVYDFTGVRDVEKLLDIAQEVGLYVIARQGPYVNGEADAGGYPGWLTTIAGRARSDAPDYLAASDEWLTRIDSILARHQLTNGTGPIILYQIENELSAHGESQKRYMQHLYDKARADGITVPIFHNDKGRNGLWVPRSSNVPGTVAGPVDLYAFDNYPGGPCRGDATPGKPNSAPDWGIWGPGGARGGASASPETPGFTAEFGGGWFDHWGSAGTYACTSVRQGPGYERVFYGTNIINGLTIQNFYMAFGGTSWGWIPAPVVYTSYDYGAGLDEARQIRPKLTALKEMGLFLQGVAPITKLTKGEPVAPSSPAIKVYDDVNPDVGTHVYFVVHDPSSATTDDTVSFRITTSDGSYLVPQSGTLRINGQDAKMLVADYAMEGQHLVYSTSEILTHWTDGNEDFAVLHGRDHEDGETVLRYASRPRVEVLSGDVASTFDPATGDLRLDYTHGGLARLRITGGGHRPLTLLLADGTTTATFWRPDSDAGAVVVRGPELVRTARVSGGTVELTGDTKEPAPLEVWAPSGVRRVSWNGADVPVRRTDSGSLVATSPLPGPDAVTLPDLSRAVWRVAEGSPEAAPSFDDSRWQAANHTSTNSTTKPEAGRPVLTMDDYGFHYGDVWYRGRFAGAADSVRLRFGGGGAGLLQAWLDGTYLGQHVLPSGGAQSPPTTGTAAFAVPAALRGAGPHVLAVMVRNDGHNEDGGANDAYKEGRGLISVALTDSTGAALPTAIAWKIQGSLGGEDLPDTARGQMNNGGLYGERHGWYLPGFADGSWRTASVPATTATPGTTWYRTTFDLDVPEADDASLGITIGDPATPRSAANYRALIFVNGWNMGQYVANVGPQHTFIVPNGVLNPRGANTLAIAVTSDGGAGNGLEAVKLVNLGTVRGGVPVKTNDAPGWDARWGGEKP